MKPADHPDIPSPKVGVLLINLGTPDAPDAKAVRRYLKEFLSDRRVVELPPWLWQPILRGAVLTTRPKKSAHAYSLVWTDQGLYPQYSGATTATANDAAFAALAAMRWQPAIRTLPPYHDDPAYIGALAESIRGALAQLDFVPDALVASFHGMPQRTLELGDPYHCHCRKTARLLGEALDRKMIVAFQSRFGKAKWLGPATDITLAELGKAGRKVAIFAPGFSADCLETLEELAIRGRDSFIAAGGRDFAYLPCLNSDRPGMEMMETLMMRELAGWLEAS
jgi:ferrochelatase